MSLAAKLVDEVYRAVTGRAADWCGSSPAETDSWILHSLSFGSGTKPVHSFRQHRPELADTCPCQ